MDVQVDPLLQFVHHFSQVIQVFGFLQNEQHPETNLQVEFCDVPEVEDLFGLAVMRRLGREPERLVRLVFKPGREFTISYYQFHRSGREKVFESECYFDSDSLHQSPLAVANEVANEVIGWVIKGQADKGESNRLRTFGLFKFHQNPSQD